MLSKIKFVISKIDEIDKIIPKVLQIEESAAEIKELLESLNTRVGELENKTRDSERLFQKKNNQKLFTRIMNLERYSRDYNIRIIGLEEEEGEDCITILLNSSLHTYNTRYAASQNLYKTRVRTNTGKQTISYMASIFWHNIPPYMKNLNLYKFSKQIKLYLFSDQLENS